MFESAPQSNSQESKLDGLMSQMIIEIDGKWRAAQAANRNENPYDMIDTVLDNNPELTISERLKAKNNLITHLRRQIQ